jgi:hypothetical protein
VLIAQRWTLACLRNRTFHSLDELNEAIGELLERRNTRSFVKLEGRWRSGTADAPGARRGIDLRLGSGAPRRRILKEIGALAAIYGSPATSG